MSFLQSDLHQTAAAKAGSSSPAPGPSCPISVRLVDLRLPLRSGGLGRPWSDLQEGPVCGQHPGLSSATSGGGGGGEEDESDSSPGAAHQEARMPRPPFHLPGNFTRLAHLSHNQLIGLYQHGGVVYQLRNLLKHPPPTQSHLQLTRTSYHLKLFRNPPRTNTTSKNGFRTSSNHLLEPLRIK